MDAELQSLKDAPDAVLTHFLAHIDSGGRLTPANESPSMKVCVKCVKSARPSQTFPARE